MKTTITLVTAAMLLATPLAVQDARAEFEFNLGAGMNAPTGDYGDQANMGYTVNAGFGYRINTLASLGIESSYSGNGAKDEIVEALGPGVDMSTSIFQYSLVAKVMMPMGRHAVFAKGSVGSYRGSAKLSSPGGDISITNTDPGYAFGGGIILGGSSNASLLADVTYHTISYDGSDTTYLDFTLGALVRLDFKKHSMRDDLEKDLEKLRE